MLSFFKKNSLIFIFLFFASLAVILLIPTSSLRYPSNHADYINHLALIIQAKSALLEWQFPLRIAPFEHNGWRYPLF
ncbi:MAG: hypothetical protein P4M12_04495 [Gammaproteobacteria bacterium]|nr:hypothetical protein [Gammaproteobacteria bacterium]